jgi:hypothetical protein
MLMLFFIMHYFNLTFHEIIYYFFQSHVIKGSSTLKEKGYCMVLVPTT